MIRCCQESSLLLVCFVVGACCLWPMAAPRCLWHLAAASGADDSDDEDSSEDEGPSRPAEGGRRSSMGGRRGKKVVHCCQTCTSAAAATDVVQQSAEAALRERRSKGATGNQLHSKRIWHCIFWRVCRKCTPWQLAEAAQELGSKPCTGIACARWQPLPPRMRYLLCLRQRTPKQWLVVGIDGVSWLFFVMAMAPICRTLVAPVCSCIYAEHAHKAASIEHKAPRPLVPDFVCRTLMARS